MTLVIFDLDGTLVDSQSLIIHNMQVAFKSCGLTPPSDDAIAGVIGLSLEHLIMDLLPNAGRDVHATVVQQYRTEALRKRAEGEDAEDLFAGIRDVIEHVRLEGYMLGIATGKARRGVDHFCTRFGMDGWFDTIQTPDTNPSKPHPGMIDSAVKETGARTEQTIMIGDTTFDMEMARNAGVSAVGVAWGNHPISMLEQAGAHHIVKVVDELPQTIGQLLEEGTQR